MVDGIIFFKEQIYLPPNSKLTSSIIDEFHGSTREGYMKTLQRIKSNFYWQAMSRQIKDFIRCCDTCQYHKVEHLAPARLLQPLIIPTQIWEDISMDFVEGLLQSNGKTSIFVIVDILSKYAHFVLLSHSYTIVGVAQLFFTMYSSYMGFPGR